MSLALAITFLMVLSPVLAAEGPRLDVQRPVDGGFLTTKETVVSGTASPALQRLNLSGASLSKGTFSGLQWTDGKLSFTPRTIFKDDFDGKELDLSKWMVLKDPANVSVSDGHLMLNYNYTMAQPDLPIVKSKPFGIPSESDFYAEFQLQFQQYAYSGAGGGITKTQATPEDSQLAVHEQYVNYDQPWWRVLGEGKVLTSKTALDTADHVFSLAYSASSADYTILLDGNKLGTVPMKALPDSFWFGEANSVSYSYYYPTIAVDYARVWATSAEWTSEPVGLGHVSVVDGCTAAWDSVDAPNAEMALFLRTSQDNVTWSDWTVAKQNLGCSGLRASYVQFKVKIDTPSAPKDGTLVDVSGIDLDYHYQLSSVEVRRAGGSWVAANGLESWSTRMALVEDDNLIEVRATDTSSAVTTTSLHVTVDTTPPVGSISIHGAPSYTNAKEITLDLDANDKYGVEWVELANSADFVGTHRMPYATSVHWTLEGAEGPCAVYARFIDAHGLASEPVSVSIFYDDIAPLASISINGLDEYTGTRSVSLDLAYSDNTGVSMVELSNSPDLAGATPVAKGEKAVKAWALAGGADGQRTVYIRVTDVAGNVIVASDSIGLFAPKAVGSVTIDGGVMATQNPIVDLRIDAPIEYRMRLMQITASPTFDGVEWEAFANEKIYILPQGDGEKTVSVRFQDFRDIVSLPVLARIILDTTPPVVTVTIDDGALYTTDPEVTVKVGYSDACTAAKMWVSGESSFARIEPQDFKGLLTWTIPTWEFDHPVYVRVSDAAGNVGDGHATIRFATVTPTIALGLPDGPSVRPGATVALQVDAIDPYGGVEVQFAVDAEPGPSAPWHAINGLIIVDVPGDLRDGAHTIHVRARNAPGLTSAPSTIGIGVDSIAPTVTIILPEDGTTIRQESHEFILRVDAKDSTAVASVSYNVDGGDARPIPKETLEVNVTVASFGEHTIEVVAEDLAGNVARGRTTFLIEQGAAPVSGTSGTILVFLLVAVISVSAVAYGGYRTRKRHAPKIVRPGDGWVEEFTASHLVGTDPHAVPPSPPVPPETTPAKTPEVAPSGGLDEVAVLPTECTQGTSMAGVPEGKGSMPTEGTETPPQIDGPEPADDAPMEAGPARDAPQDWEEF